jgi:uncharacterized protein with ATP-grasp and redox domains
LADGEKRFQLIRSVLETLFQEFRSEANLGLITNRIIEVIDEFIFQSAPYYDEFKLKSNQLAKELIPSAKIFIDKGQTDQEKFVRACYLATAGNVAPIGAPSESFRFQEVSDLLAGKKSLPVVMGDAFEAAKRAEHILYVTDNSGEIGFDSLLISKLKEMGSKITLLVKEDYFFEDATVKDAGFFHLDRFVDDLLSVKGLFVPGHTPSSLTDPLSKSDLVISKGTGNYEALQGELKGKPSIHMLKVKCKPIAMKIGVQIGTFIVKTYT